MKEQLGQRLGELKAEFESGQKMLADLEAKRANLGETLTRISGAIQVLEEEIAKAEDGVPDADIANIDAGVESPQPDMVEALAASD